VESGRGGRGRVGGRTVGVGGRCGTGGEGAEGRGRGSGVREG